MENLAPSRESIDDMTIIEFTSHEFMASKSSDRTSIGGEPTTSGVTQQVAPGEAAESRQVGAGLFICQPCGDHDGEGEGDEEEEEEGYEEESVDDKELEPDPEFVPGVQSSGYGWGCLLMCLRSCMLTHAC